MKRFWLFLASLFSGAVAQSAPDPLQPLLTFAAKQPQDVAVVVATVQPDGSLKPGLIHNGAQAMPLASTRKIVVLAAYARAVSAGKLDPTTPVKLADWEAYYLPGTDGGAHAASLEALKIPADPHGRAKNPQQTVPLDTLARFMMETSDNAATDLILTRLGPQAIPDTIRTLNLTGQQDFGPISGLFSAWDDPSIQSKYATLPLTERVKDAWNRAETLSRTPALRDPAAITKRRPALALSWQQPVQTDTRGSVNDYASIMARVLSGTGFTKQELEVMRRHLGWPMRVNPANAEVYNAVYGKGGSLAGVLTQNLRTGHQERPQSGVQSLPEKRANGSVRSAVRQLGRRHAGNPFQHGKRQTVRRCP